MFLCSFEKVDEKAFKHSIKIVNREKVLLLDFLPHKTFASGELMLMRLMKFIVKICKHRSRES